MYSPSRIKSRQPKHRPRLNPVLMINPTSTNPVQNAQSHVRQRSTPTSTWKPMNASHAQTMIVKLSNACQKWRQARMKLKEIAMQQLPPTKLKITTEPQTTTEPILKQIKLKATKLLLPKIKAKRPPLKTKPRHPRTKLKPTQPLPQAKSKQRKPNIIRTCAMGTGSSTKAVLKR